MRVVFTTLLLLFLSLASEAQSPWRLIWSDEFSGPANSPPNASKWLHDLGGGGWGNRELEVYTDRPQNAFQDGKGHLIIRAIRTEEGRYTSSRLKTKGSFAFTYGKVEARIRIPYGQGVWPAFWMLGADFDDKHWPACGEIDVLENIGKEPLLVHGTVHGPGYSGGKGISFAYKSQASDRFADRFHVYSVDWSPNRIVFSVDGHRYGEVTPSGLPPGSKWVFDHPFFILLNMAVGGEWPGYPDSSSVFPQSMLVDWIRVWQRDRVASKVE